MPFEITHFIAFIMQSNNIAVWKRSQQSVGHRSLRGHPNAPKIQESKYATTKQGHMDCGLIYCFHRYLTLANAVINMERIFAKGSFMRQVKTDSNKACWDWAAITRPSGQ